MAGDIYLVRHGQYNSGVKVDDPRNPAVLTDEGIRQAEMVRDELVGRNLGSNVLLLSSIAPRAVQTANIISAGLGTRVMFSMGLEAVGKDPSESEDLDAMLRIQLEHYNVVQNSAPLVAVTHAPLIAIATGLRTSHPSEKIQQGVVYRYEPGTWNLDTALPGH